MKYLLRQITLLCILGTSFCLAQSSGGDSTTKFVQLAQLEMVKAAIVKKMTADDLKEVAGKAEKLGLREYSYYFRPASMGWMLKSKDDWELAYITIHLHEGRAHSGECLGAIAKFPLAQQIHELLVENMNKTYKQIAPDEYDLGDDYIVNVSLFKGNTGLGRSRLSIKRKT